MNQFVYEQLVEVYNNQHEALEKEEASVNLCEHKYLGCCLDCMEYMDQNYQIDLDCSEVSLEVIDIFIHHAHEAWKEGTMSHIDRFAEMLAGYVGLVLQSEVGGNWIYDDEGEALEIQSHHFPLHTVVMSAIEQDTSLLEFVKEIKNNLIAHS